MFNSSLRAAAALSLMLLACPGKIVSLGEAAEQTQGWSLADINNAIDISNFIVDRGCSGTLISVTEKLVLTNYHCIDDHIETTEREVASSEGFIAKKKFRRYTDVTVEQWSYDRFVRTNNTSYVSEIVAEKKELDLALLRIKGKIPHSYASSLLPEGETVTRGEKVYVVGNPLGEDGTLVEGIISSTSRTFEVPWAGGEKLPFYQLSAGIAGGNSGGALYDSRGYLIGVPAAGYRQATFIGFAIPVENVRVFLRGECYGRVFDGKADDDACRKEKDKKKDKKDD